jgi:hypothetical protein
MPTPQNPGKKVAICQNSKSPSLNHERSIDSKMIEKELEFILKDGVNSGDSIGLDQKIETKSSAG